MYESAAIATHFATTPTASRPQTTRQIINTRPSKVHKAFFKKTIPPTAPNGPNRPQMGPKWAPNRPQRPLIVCRPFPVQTQQILRVKLQQKLPQGELEAGQEHVQPTILITTATVQQPGLLFKGSENCLQLPGKFCGTKSMKPRFGKLSGVAGRGCSMEIDNLRCVAEFEVKEGDSKQAFAFAFLAVRGGSTLGISGGSSLQTLFPQRDLSRPRIKKSPPQNQLASSV